MFVNCAPENLTNRQTNSCSHKPGQSDLDLTVPNLSFDMLHEHPHRYYNNLHRTAR